MKERRKEKKNLSLTLGKAGHQSSAEPPAASPCTTTPPGGTELPHPDHLPENPLCFLCLDLSIASQPITAK